MKKYKIRYYLRLSDFSTEDEYDNYLEEMEDKSMLKNIISKPIPFSFGRRKC
jgi:hypothetical protein